MGRIALIVCVVLGIVFIVFTVAGCIINRKVEISDVIDIACEVVATAVFYAWLNSI